MIVVIARLIRDCGIRNHDPTSLPLPYRGRFGLAFRAMAWSKRKN
jgi:hypothetical protein